MRQSVLGALLLAIALGLGPGRALGAAGARTPEGARYEEGILVSENPALAEEFLAADPSVQAGRIGDPELYRRLYRQSLELLDLKDLFTSSTRGNPIRDQLLLRGTCDFCLKPAEARTWARTYLALDSKRADALDDAYMEWPTLTKEARTWLAAHGSDEASWAALGLEARLQRINPFAAEEYGALLASAPGDKAGIARMKDRLDGFYDYLSSEYQRKAERHIERHEAAIEALAAARKRMAAVRDPRLKALLTEAAAEPDVEARLAKLGALFDGLGSAPPSLRTAAPPRADQRFDDSSRSALAALVKTGLMREISGTWAGDELTAFYAREPLKLTIAPGRDGSFGTLRNGEMRFNEAYIEDYLKLKNRTMADLLREPRLLGALVTELSALFVHESQHYRQEVWAREHHLPDIVDQSVELEAMQVEALYILEKGLRDPHYRRQLKADRADIKLAQASVRLSERLRRDGPLAFRQYIRTYHYADKLSLEGHLGRTLDYSGVYVKELARRKTLPQAEQDALALPRSGGAVTMADIPTPSLEKALTDFNPDDARPEVYALYRDRLAGANAQTAERLRSLLAEKNPERRRPAATVPPPGAR